VDGIFLFSGRFMKSRHLSKLLLLLLLPATLLLCHCSGDGKGFSLARKGPKPDLARCEALSQKKKYEEAIKCFEVYKSRDFGSTGAADADLAIADAYFHNKDYLVAAEAYNLFVQTYPRHERVPYAYLQSGMSYYKQIPKGIDRDFGSLDNAMSQFQTVLNYYSDSSYAEEARAHLTLAQLKIAKKHFYIGRYYYRYNEYLAAIPRFEIIANDYPRLGLEEKTYYYLIRSLKKTQQTELAMRYFDIFKKFYPEKEKTIKKIAAIF
jgi:outer membrane protein assembly factor BamD